MMKLLGLMIAVSALGIAQVAVGQAPSPGHREPTRLIEAVPAGPYYLFQWPGMQMLAGEHRMQASSAAVKNAKTQSARWIKAVLSQDWRPRDESKMVFLRKEFHGWDTARVQWDHEGFRLEASQTRTVFALKITPLETRGTGQDAQERVKFARELAAKVFSSESFMYQLDGQGNARLPVSDLQAKIVQFSFRPSQVEVLSADKTVIGMPMEEPEVAATTTASSPPEDVTQAPQAWSYWFRHIRWWNDGKSVGFYFLKLDGPGPEIISYAGNSDANWFR